MTPADTPTPRTDAAAGYVNNEGNFIQSEQCKWHVQVNFARQLERELSTMTAERDQLARDYHQPQLCDEVILGLRKELAEVRQRLRDLVTTDHESKEAFIARVREALAEFGEV